MGKLAATSGDNIKIGPTCSICLSLVIRKKTEWQKLFDVFILAVKVYICYAILEPSTWQQVPCTGSCCKEPGNFRLFHLSLKALEISNAHALGDIC
jgi:hypothetical protein